MGNSLLFGERTVLTDPISGRLLLQSDRVNSVLPDVFKLPSCSSYGSHNTTWLREEVPRWRLGLAPFGPELAEGTFHPLSSVYVEPIIALTLPGLSLFIFFNLVLTVFCYRRYELGLCGEPFPTVKQYLPREVNAVRLVTTLTLAILIMIAGTALLVVNLSVDNGTGALVAATTAIEETISTSFGVGRELLGTALGIISKLDGFYASLAAEVDVAKLLERLTCTEALLAPGGSPEGAEMLHVVDGINEAMGLRPDADALAAQLAALAAAAAQIPLRVPPVSTALATAEAQRRLLPPLPDLAAAVDELNASATNATGRPSEAVAGLNATNVTLSGLPDLPLLISRLGNVYYGQNPNISGHICANLPVGWKEGDVTECDELRAALRLAVDVLDAAAPARPLILLRELRALLDGFPPLVSMSANLTTLQAELVGVPNLTLASLDYDVLNASLVAWDQKSIVDMLGMVRDTAAQLAAARPQRIAPNLELQRGAVAPLACADQALTMLSNIDAQLLALPTDVAAANTKLVRLGAALRALPDPDVFGNGTRELALSLEALPNTRPYFEAIESLEDAIAALPAGAPLQRALAAVQDNRFLPSTHEALVNVTAALDVAINSLPDLTPFDASLSALNESRTTLPPLLTEALAAIERYDLEGDDSNMGSLDLASAALAELDAAVRGRPAEYHLRRALRRIDRELRALPPSPHHAAQARALDGALALLPPLPRRVSLLDTLATEAAAVPSVPALGSAFYNLNASLETLPSLDEAKISLTHYKSEVDALVSPPSPDRRALLGPAHALRTQLATIKAVVDSGQAAVDATHDETLVQLELLERGLFGEDKRGYTAAWLDIDGRVYSVRFIFLLVSFGIPVALGGVAAFSCITRRGGFSLHAGHALLVSLPWIWLLGASVELPASVVLSDACGQLEDFVYTWLGRDGISASLVRAREPVYGYMTGCVRDDPMVNFFEPIKAAAAGATDNVTLALDDYTLRPAMVDALETLEGEMGVILAALATVREVMSCGNVHALYKEAKTAVCCDWAYAANFLWVSRVATAVVTLPAAVAAIAGYKRFHKTLWGPYASVQSQEVGAYL